MINKVKIKDLSKDLPEIVDLFIMSSSFESRCLTIAKIISPQVNSAILVRNKEYKAGSNKHNEHLKSLFESRASEVELSLSSPTDSADALRINVVKKIEDLSAGTVFIDITTFTHEQLLILIALLNMASYSCNILMGYTGAGEYSTNTETDNIWLSRGIKNVRSVLGYPGRMLPTRKLHLVILVGFESERAQTLIEIMEPDKISLGRGRPDESYSRSHYERNQMFFKKIEQFLHRQSRVQLDTEQFLFSCMNPIDTRDDVLNIVRKNPGFNTVVCPMNTKFSTVGAGLASIEEDDIQIVYTQAVEYNERGYSSPGDMATIFQFGS